MIPSFSMTKNTFSPSKKFLDIQEDLIDPFEQMNEERKGNLFGQPPIRSWNPLLETEAIRNISFHSFYLENNLYEYPLTKKLKLDN